MDEVNINMPYFNNGIDICEIYKILKNADNKNNLLEVINYFLSNELSIEGLEFYLIGLIKIILNYPI